MQKIKKITVLVDARVFDLPYYQGSRTYIYGIYNSLVKNDRFEITMCASNIENLRSNFEHPNFRFLEVPKEGLITRLFWRFPKILRNKSFDYAHFQYMIPFIRKARYITTIHDILFLDFQRYFPTSYILARKLLFRYAARNADILLTVSDYSKHAIANHFKIDLARILVTPNAVHRNEILDNIDIRKGHEIDNYILYVSRFEPRKNHFALLRAYVELDLYSQHINLVFIGKRNSVDTKEFNEYYDRLELHIKHCIYFLEDIDDKSLARFYKNARIFIYPSLAEGFGIPPLEAAMYNCKVLCSNSTAMREFDFFPYRFDPNNYSELKQKLSLILTDQQYPHDLIQKEITKKYNWDLIAETLGSTLIVNFG